MAITPLKLLTKIYIIESPSESDIKNGVQEGADLSAALRSVSINHTYIEASTIEKFTDAIKTIASNVEEIKKELGAITIHLSMHGNKNGIGLTSREFISWKDFAQILDIIFKVAFVPKEFKGIKLCPLTLCFSTCEGLNSVHINDYCSDDESLFHMIVGPKEKISWKQAKEAFISFHKDTLDGMGDAPKAIAEMNKVAGLDDIFQAKLGKGLKWLED
jgi:hypothetical protein